ncbi:MAG: TatD family hydrolase [Bdellovibrionaceae bacterium]|nr:TatD family hydrolase [Pseudobdellovibrionaceae bacterium]
MLEWMDLHAHLNMLEEGPEEALRLAREVGVVKVATIGTEPEDLPLVLALAEKNYPNVFCTLGIHPHEGRVYTAEIGAFIEANVSKPWVIAIGEIGLDYHYDQSPREEQKSAFRAQLDIAVRTNMPIQIHTRDADEDTIMILKEYAGRVKGIIHCFTGTPWLAQEALALGYNISISGVVTFKNAESLREIVRNLPMDRIHVETDSPFLAPMPMRGRKNTPAFVVHTAKFVAELKGVTLEDLCTATRENALKMFPKIQW